MMNGNLPLAVSAWPTETHLVEEAHETSTGMLHEAPATLGLDWIDHDVPFQRTTYVLAPFLPVAMQFELEVQKTPRRLDSPDPPGGGAL
jgi:hypothetical protein